eukprot:c4621_g2_i1.p1 GENE.c4621_g2_i1~~c4621_g2_i1.p1  ORF type:complete len:154 (+),score=38.97 c4621_g2_i1:53-463(+)
MKVVFLVITFAVYCICLITSLPVNENTAQELLSTKSESELNFNMSDELWDCDWYKNQTFRATVAINACHDYLEKRSIGCLEWTKSYTTKYPSQTLKIPLEEVYIKCRHVKDKLDQLVHLPGDIASCSWCMQNVNTN